MTPAKTLNPPALPVVPSARTARRDEPSDQPQAGSLDIVILGLSITSSWGNGHATTFRGLVRELTRRGHRVTFLERDMPWYADNRDMPAPPWGRTELYRSLPELKKRFAREVRRADVVIVGSYVPDGVAVGEWACRTASAAPNCTPASPIYGGASSARCARPTS